MRLRPAIVLAVLLVVLRFVLPLVYPAGGLIATLGSVVLALAIAAWWLFFSRAPWSERLGVFAFAVVALMATSFVVDPSIRGGVVGVVVWVAAPPDLALALVLGAIASRHLSAGARRTVIAAAIVLACGAWTMLRTDGIMGGGGAQLHFRWTPTAEERLLAEGGNQLDAPAPVA